MLGPVTTVGARCVVTTPVASIDSLQAIDIPPTPTTSSRWAARFALRRVLTGGLMTGHTRSFTAVGSEPLDTLAADGEDKIEARTVDDAVLLDPLTTDAPVGILGSIHEGGVMFLILPKRDVRALCVHLASGHTEDVHV